MSKKKIQECLWTLKTPVPVYGQLQLQPTEIRWHNKACKISLSLNSQLLPFTVTQPEVTKIAVVKIVGQSQGLVLDLGKDVDVDSVTY